MHRGNPILDNKKKIEKFRAQFFETFGISVMCFMDLVCGFNIVVFDEYLGTPDGISTKDFIAEKFGADAANLIEDLLTPGSPLP
jgi:hypothetical protein